MQEGENMEKYKPTEAELEILDILWRDGPSTVKHVNDILNTKKNVGYTTTLKILQILYDKQIVAREKKGRSHIYKPLVKKNEAQGMILEKILETAFSGSASKLVMQALGRKETTQIEINEIKKFLESLEIKDDGNK